MAYQAGNQHDRWKAIAASIVVTGVIGAGILAGLQVEIVGRAVERLETFDISLPRRPPPPPPPPPQQQARQQEGAPAAPKASPVVAPKPEIQLPIQSPVVAAPKAGTGASSSTGQNGAGTGAGAGGSGSGAGSGSGGGGGGFTPARRVQKIPDAEYRRFVSASGMRSGRVGLTVKVNTDGRPSNCRIVRSSGNSSADSLMCQLTLRFVRFQPARDPQGRPVAQDVTWFPDWAPNR
jgi:protein TonB